MGSASHPGSGLTFDSGCVSYADALWARASADPDGEVLRTTAGERWTAAQLLDRTVACAEALGERVVPGDVVVSCVDTSPEAVVLTAAISALGAVELPIAADSPPPWVHRLVQSASARLVVGSRARARSGPIRDIAALTRQPLELIDDIVDACLTDRSRSVRFTPVTLDPTAPALMMSTSGTTGRSKTALLPGGAPMGQARRVATAMHYGPDDVLLTCFAWHHINARNATVLPALISGARVVMSPRFSASEFWDVARREQVTAFNFMGAMCAMLLRQPARPGDRRHRVRKAYGGPAPASLVDDMIERFGVTLRQAYACTELGDVATTGLHELRPGAAGRPVDDHEVQIVDTELQPVPDGSVGEILVRPRRPGLAVLEYLDDPAATAAAWTDGWFRTHDRGRLDDGWLYVTGRSSDTIRRRGVNIDPEQVEAVLGSHPAVAEVAAVGVPSELTEDDVLAVVVPIPGQNPTAADLRDHCVRHLPAAWVPRYFHLEHALPHTAAFKLDRASLRRRGVPATAEDLDNPPRSTQHR